VKLLALAATVLVSVASVVVSTSACSSTAKGDVSTTCPDDGGCQPQTVFATGVLSAVLVTSDSVYAGDIGGNVYAADKPLRASRVLSTGSSTTRGVAAFARTSHGLYWFTSPSRTQQDPHPKSALVWFPTEASAPVVIDDQLARPRGMAVINDILYLAVPGHVLQLRAGETKLESVLDVDAYALRSNALSLFFTDGLATISSWRLGDSKPEVRVTGGSFTELASPSDLTYREPPFVVDDSGFYWLQTGFVENALGHAPLAGGVAERPIVIAKEYAKAITLDDGHVYWTQADSLFLPQKTAIHRAAKSALDKDEVVASFVGDATGLQAMPEGLYIAASPSFTDLDATTLGFKRYGGPLVIVPRAMLDARP
jgi:hypothetical protein